MNQLSAKAGTSTVLSPRHRVEGFDQERPYQSTDRKHGACRSRCSNTVGYCRPKHHAASARAAKHEMRVAHACGRAFVAKLETVGRGRWRRGPLLGVKSQCRK